MVATTPHLDDSTLGALASRYVDVETLPWKPTPYAGIEIKILMEDKTTGLLTALFRWAPGSKLPLHEHVDLEQTFVLQGTLVDAEGTATAGNYVWRPQGSRHDAVAPDGALVLSFFLRPNTFMDV
jgi:anti-sigma factor ChrR (cupin superfamily)